MNNPTVELEPKWFDASNSELIEHILSRYHERHREQFVELVQLADRVEFVHNEDPLCPNGLKDHLIGMQSELLDHMEKEEEILFPMLKQELYAPGPISVMESDHVAHLDEIEHIFKLTNNFTLPNDACGTWKEFYQQLYFLVEDLQKHIRLENEVLFREKKAHGEGFCCGSCGGS